MKEIVKQMKNKTKIIIIFGTRPEAIKMLPVVLELRKHDCFDTKVIVTAQHREMLDQVMDLFGITADYDLNIMKKSQSLNYITSEIINELKVIFDKEEPDMVLVHGDTTTTLASSMAAFYNNIPIGHVEAGLRTFDYQNPYPEEMNRVLTDKMASLLFAPTEQSYKNLIKDQLNEDNIIITGNTVIDALYYTLPRAKEFKINNEEILKIDTTKKMILVTAHRRENWGEPLKDICNALLEISNSQDVEIIYPVHPNINVLPIVESMLGNKKNIHLIKPVDYIEMIKLMDMSYLILTDSGGLQEEGPSLGKPVLVMRKTTERPEAVIAGTVKLVGTDTYTIVNSVINLLTSKEKYDIMAKATNPYGDGHASERIVSKIKEYFFINK